MVERHAILWRRLDEPGHDACRIEQNDDGWLITGAAVFRHGSAPAWTRYEVQCDASWRTLNCFVEGFMSEPIRLGVARDDGRWVVNGRPKPDFDRVDDVDLGFTPATNLLAIRRLGLEIGEGSSVDAVWFDVEDQQFKLLPQLYCRLSQTRYRYSSPLHGYEAVLDVDRFGCVIQYPGLWIAEPSDGSS